MKLIITAPRGKMASLIVADLQEGTTSEKT